MSTLATLQHPAVVFREEQNFDWRVYTLAGLIELALGLGLLGGRSWSFEMGLVITAGLAFSAFTVLILFHMTTLATPTEVCVWFGWLPLYRRSVPIASVRRVEVVTFRPIADYGFWGIGRGRSGERALFARGNQGVRIFLCDGGSILIGSQRPAELAAAIELAAHPPV